MVMAPVLRACTSIACAAILILTPAEPLGQVHALATTFTECKDPAKPIESRGLLDMRCNAARAAPPVLRCGLPSTDVVDPDADHISTCLENLMGTDPLEQDSDRDGIPDGRDAAPLGGDWIGGLAYIEFRDAYDGVNRDTSCDQDTKKAHRAFDPFLNGIKAEAGPYSAGALTPAPLLRLREGNTKDVAALIGHHEAPPKTASERHAYLEITELAVAMPPKTSSWFTTAIDFRAPPQLRVTVYNLVDQDRGGWIDLGENGEPDPIEIPDLPLIPIVKRPNSGRVTVDPEMDTGCRVSVTLEAFQPISAEQWVAIATTGAAAQLGTVATLQQYYDNLEEFRG